MILFLLLLFVGCLSQQQIAPPVIDILPLMYPHNYSSEEIQSVRASIHEACKQWGFFNVINHNISDKLQESVYEQMVLFFNSSISIKDSVRRQPNNSRGFADNELTKQIMDMKEVFDVGTELYYNLSEVAAADQAIDGENFWPIDDSLIHFRETIQEYYEECRKLSEILIETILSTLNCESSRYIENSFHQHSSFLRLNYYPIISYTETEVSMNGDYQIDEKLGISRHTDAGALTILMQDSSALEVYSGSKQDFNDGEWIPVEPIPGALTINTGDMLQVWSNDLFKAPEHRVKASRTSKRYSIPFFFNPSYDTLVHPILCNNISTDDDNITKPKYKDIRWGYFRTQRFKGDFQNIGKEIQIEDFRIV